MKYLGPLAKPFSHKGSDEGVLLLHGFTGSPSKLIQLGEYLNTKGGYTVECPLLRGHGTSVDDMIKASWKDWIEDAQVAYEKLAQKCTKINVVGLSMGGLLALHLASTKNVKKLVCIAPALIIRNKFGLLTPVAKHFIKQVPKIPDRILFPFEVDKYDLSYNIDYHSNPLKSVQDLLILQKKIRRVLKNITCPTLIIQSPKDEIVVPKSANIIYDKIASENKQLFWLKESRHKCTIGPEKDIIFDQIIKFLKD